MQMDPCNALPHAQSTIVLYTELDAKCDQQLTVIGQLLTALCHTHQCQVFSTKHQQLLPICCTL